MRSRVPIVSFAGFKHTGKTTLIARLVEVLSGRGTRVGCIKHDGHDFVAQHEDVDSGKFFGAGAAASMIASSTGHVLAEWQYGRAPELNELISRMGKVDLILVEGYKDQLIPKWVLLEPLDGNRVYKIPEFAKIPEIKGQIQGYIVPSAPLKVADTDMPVYHRDNILGILSAIELMIRTVYTN